MRAQPGKCNYILYHGSIIIKTISYLIQYLFVRAFCFFVLILPRRLAISLGELTGKTAEKLLKKRVALAHKNLQHAFGNSLSYDEREKIISGLFKILGQSLIESIIFKPEDVDGNIEIDGLDNLKAALHKGRGAILVVPHFGGWEIQGYVFSRYFKGGSVIYKPLKNPFLNKYLIRQRLKIGLQLILDKNALKAMFKNLKSGRIIGFLYDQNAAGDGIPATFFGGTASTHSAPAAFALNMDCAVVPSYIIKLPGFRKYKAVIQKPFPLVKSGNKEADLLDNTQKYNDFLEDLVREYPQHWLGWLHKRWSGKY
ncbi:MAG: lysophospholipid acyltransferase family protein [bacterium]